MLDAEEVRTFVQGTVHFFETATGHPATVGSPYLCIDKSAVVQDYAGVIGISGIVRSSVMTSGISCLNLVTASRPFTAVPTTSSRSFCCERSMRRRITFESSTIIMRNCWRGLGTALMI